LTSSGANSTRTKRRTSSAGDPDAWLIAYAKAKDLTLVTHEGSHPDSRAKIFIPDVCAAFGMRPIDSFAMLDQISTRFEWRPPS